MYMGISDSMQIMMMSERKIPFHIITKQSTIQKTILLEICISMKMSEISQTQTYNLRLLNDIMHKKYNMHCIFQFCLRQINKIPYIFKSVLVRKYLSYCNCVSYTNYTLCIEIIVTNTELIIIIIIQYIYNACILIKTVCETIIIITMQMK